MQTLSFDNQFTRILPADPEPLNQRREVRHALYSRVTPKPAPRPVLAAYSREAAELIGLGPADCESNDFLQVFAGNRQLPGMDPHATVYGGHQFGNWAGQLGDGRAINLGEVETAAGHWMLQLKGAGPTPYSRTADGLAVLRSSVREFLCSEAMYHLGVPTTRALCLIVTGEEVMRDMLYDGNPALEPGAVVCRMSSSFVRFGHFQLLAARQDYDLLRTFTDFVIRREFPHLDRLDERPVDTYLSWFREICERTSSLVTHWMRVGFVHGVMNTDNLSILGETIDYGPYGWLEDFDADWTPNTTDAANRRYRYGQQPGIAQWNLMQLANAVLPLVGEPAPLEEALTDFARDYEQRWQQMMADKLGLAHYDSALVDALLQLLSLVETDMTLFFRYLGRMKPDGPDPDALLDAYYQPPTADTLTALGNWLQQYRNALQTQKVSAQERQLTMARSNPVYVLRNYLAQLAIDDAEAGDFGQINELLNVLRKPYEEQPGRERFAAKRPEWARTRVGCSMLSCSS